MLYIDIPIKATRMSPFLSYYANRYARSRGWDLSSPGRPFGMGLRARRCLVTATTHLYLYTYLKCHCYRMLGMQLGQIAMWRVWPCPAYWGYISIPVFQRWAPRNPCQASEKRCFWGSFPYFYAHFIYCEQIYLTQQIHHSDSWILLSSVVLKIQGNPSFSSRQPCYLVINWDLG